MAGDDRDATTLTTAQMRELATRPGASAVGIDISPNDVIAASIARSDQQIRQAVHNIHVPEGLRQRVLSQLDRRDRVQLRRRRRRALAVAMTTIAASLLTFVLLRPFGKSVLDAEAIAEEAVEINDQFLAERGSLTRGPAGSDWPEAILPQTCIGRRDVAFFGQRATAYQLAAGHTRAVLIVIPESRFPFQLAGKRIVVPQSTSQVDVHCFASGSRVCVLIVPSGADPKQFETIRSIT